MAIFRVPVDLTWAGKGSPGVNVFHFRSVYDKGDPLLPAALGSALDKLELLYQNIMTPYGAPGMTSAFQGEVIDVQTKEIVNADPWTVTSNTSSTSAPTVLQVCCTWRTSIAARRGRGRTFFGPLKASTQDVNGSILDSPLGLMRASVTQFANDSQAINGGAFGVWGLESEGGTAKVLRDITGGAIKDQFAVLRSRRD